MPAPKALVVGIHHWQSPFKVGTHYIVEHLLSLGFQVAHVSAPLTPLHRLLPDTGDFLARRTNHSAGGLYEVDKQLWHYVPYALVAPSNHPLLSASLVARQWQHLSIPLVSREIKDRGFGKVDLLFLDSIYQPFWLDSVEFVQSAYRLADNTSGFAGFSKGLANIEREIVEKVGQVFCASVGLMQYAHDRGSSQPLLLANGIDLQRFSNPKHANLTRCTGPVAVYVGAFGEWFDFQIIRELAHARPDLKILLIGPSSGLHVEFESYSNVHIVGAIDSSKVPGYLESADVGLIPFQVESYPELIHHVNPLKLYEYFAAGLPVVSTSWRELEGLGSPARLADSTEEFIKLVNEVLEQGGNGDIERDYVQQFAWDKTLEPLSNWLQPLLSLQ